ncbi:MAG: permease [Pirellulaceae bacterium]|nr:MAG: permease [Pirellulaceae bacterium]
MNVLRRKLWRDVRRSSFLMAAIAGIIAVGDTCFIAMRSSYNNLRNAMEDYYHTCRMADFWITLKRVPRAELAARMKVFGVQDWQGRIETSGRLLLAGVSYPINARLISWSPIDRARLNRPLLERGTFLTGWREDQVMVNEAFARAHRLRPGDRLRLIVRRQERELVIAGTFISSEFVYAVDVGQLLPDPRRFAVCYVPWELAEELADMRGAVNQVVGLLSKPGRRVPETPLRLLEERLEEYGVLAAVLRRQQSSHQVLNNELQGLRAFAFVVPSIFLAAAALVLHVFLGRLMRQQRTVLGTLAALGYSKGQLLRHYLAFGLMVGCLGALAGSFLGQLASWGMTAVYRHYFEFPRLESSFYPSVHAVGLVAALVASAAGSYRAVSQLLRLRPAEAMRPEPPLRARSVWLERFPRVWRRLDLAWRMVVRHLARRPARTLTALAASTAGASFLTAGLMFVAAQNFLIDFQFHRMWRSDVDFILADARPEEAWHELARLPGIVHTEPLFDWPCVFQHEHRRRLGAISCLATGARLTIPLDPRGRAIPIPHSGLVLTRKLAEVLHVREGQLVELVPMRGERRAVKAPVVRISDSYLGMAAYARIEYLHELIGSSFVLDAVQAEWSPSHQAPTELWKAVADLPELQSVRVQHDTVATLKKTLLQNQFVFIAVIVTFSGAVLFGNILNVMFVNFHERRREVAILGATGYSVPFLGKTFFREALLVNSIAWLIGIAGGYGLTWLTAVGYESEFIRLPVVLRWWNVLVAGLLSALFTAAAYGVLFRALKKLDLRDVLYLRE